jgi:alginate O-acetyltransferase complex protein AlgI
MLFTSLNFLVFFCLTMIIYYGLPQRFRWLLLLAASLVFYLFALPVYIFVILFSILLNYFFGIRIGGCENNRTRKWILTGGILLNLAFLALFRYAGALMFLMSGLHPGSPDQVVTRIIVPLGISFFTFTNISYLVEVKRRRFAAEKHIGYFACYVAFFPKLIQGPIERPQNFLPQLREEHVFDYPAVTSGIRLMLWGFFKKLVVADQLSRVVDAVYDHPLNWHGPLLAVATVLYAFQIYMDFSGYIDIARGAAKVLGFNLTRNFNNPYLSRSVKEFWSRWHISLSTWLRDYIFLPLAYFLSGRMKKEKYAGIPTVKSIYSAAITVTFLLCGLWHGSGWNFIAWGGLFAVYLVTGSLTEKRIRHFYRTPLAQAYKPVFYILEVLFTFLLICFAWIFFRSADLSAALQIVTQLFSGWTGMFTAMPGIIRQTGLSGIEAALVLILIPLILGTEYYFSSGGLAKKFQNLPLAGRWGIYYMLVLLICYFGRAETHTFIYFQF